MEQGSCVATGTRWLVQRTYPLLAGSGVVLSLLLSAPFAHGQAGGAVVYENGSPDMGSSYAGAGARAQDAATAFTNPAGMTQLDKSEVLLGSMVIFSDVKFDVDSQTVSVPPGSSNGGGHQQSIIPGLGTFLVLSFNDDLKFGFSVTALAAAGVDYDPGWVGRTLITENQLLIASATPSVGYRILDWLSVGAGVNVVYGELNQRFKASTATDAPDLKIDDADDVGVGGTFGLMFEPLDGTRIGVTYRTQARRPELHAPLPADGDRRPGPTRGRDPRR